MQAVTQILCRVDFQYLILFIIILFPACRINADETTLITNNGKYGYGYVGIPLTAIYRGNQLNEMVFKCDSVVFSIVKNDTTYSYTPLRYDRYPLPLYVTTLSRDSIRNLNPHSLPKFEVNNRISHWPIVWWPHSYAKYFNPDYNDFPITVSRSKGYTTYIDNQQIDLYSDPSSNNWIVVTPDISPGYNNYIEYKEKYSLTDTIPLLDKFINIERLDNHNKRLIFKTIELGSDKKRKEKSSPIIRNSNYTLISFFGSWCEFCIENLSHLFDIYSTYQNDIDFLTIDCEYSPSDFKEGEKILYKHNIHWDIEYELLGDGLNKTLNVDSFPYYILIDSEGKIIKSSSKLSSVEEYIRKNLLR